MSDKEDDLGMKLRSKGRKKADNKQSVVLKSGVITDEQMAINLSEDESSDEELKINEKPSTSSEESTSLKLITDVPVSSTIQTTYDFSSIMKLQADLMQARDRFNTCVDNFGGCQEDIPSNKENTCSVKELLQLGEANICQYDDLDQAECDYEEVSGQAVEFVLPNYVDNKELRRQRNKEAALTKHLNQVRNEMQKDLHKVHLLCLIAHGNYISEIINNELLYGCALSFLPAENLPPPLISLSYVQKVLKWFGKTFPQKKYKKTGSFSISKLQDAFTNLKPISIRDSVILFVSLLRGLSLTARVVINFNTVPLKIKKVGWSPADISTKVVGTSKDDVNQQIPDFVVEEDFRIKHIKQQAKIAILESSFTNQGSPSAQSINEILKGTINTDDVSSNTECNTIDPSKQPSLCQPGSSSTHDDKDNKSKKFILCEPGPSTSRTEMEHSSLDLSVTGPSLPVVCSSQKTKVNPKLVGISAKDEILYAGVSSITKEKPKQVGYNLHLNSSSSSDDELFDDIDTTVKCGVDYWAEVFIESEERWVAVDLFSLKVDCTREISNRCTHPISYILGWKNDGSLKEVTRRYAPTWLTKKYRVDDGWWANSINPFMSKSHQLDIMEDEQLNEMMEKAPMPTTFNELKNHPLYTVPRHLLKYEVIYPRDAQPLGYIKGEPIFSRYCVHLVSSREKWIQEGKSVKVGEKPYKYAKSRAKPDVVGRIKPLELFGAWQVEEYIPPIVVDGKIPKNQYGNVELYKPSMLPAGTVHLQVPGLLKIAQKLGIDCAPAVVGWQHSHGNSHPIIDGIVVCKEFQDLLLDAWNADVDHIEQMYLSKKQVRAHDNWRKFCKSILIMDRLKKKYNYNFDGELTEDDDEPLPKLLKK